MDPVFERLNFKAHREIYVHAAPEEFAPHLVGMAGLTTVNKRASKHAVDFALFFVRTRDEINNLAPRAAHSISDDGVLWFAFPAKTSKRYESDISRDDGWQPLDDLGFVGVRQIAIDADWSALRFRRAKNIKTLKRAERHTISETRKLQAG